MENKRLIQLSVISGFLAVAIGAFGAHALKPHMDENAMATFKTANQYHFYHTFLALGVLFFERSRFIRISTLAAIFALAGILLFSGSLYIISLKSIIDYPDWFPIVTPLGGLCFMASWASLFIRFFMKAPQKKLT